MRFDMRASLCEELSRCVTRESSTRNLAQDAENARNKDALGNDDFSPPLSFPNGLPCPGAFLPRFFLEISRYFSGTHQLEQRVSPTTVKTRRLIRAQGRGIVRISRIDYARRVYKTPRNDSGRGGGTGRGGGGEEKAAAAEKKEILRGRGEERGYESSIP